MYLYHSCDSFMTAVKNIFTQTKNLWIRLDELCKQMESIFYKFQIRFRIIIGRKLKNIQTNSDA